MGTAVEGELIPDGHFLPYQDAWIGDAGRFKAWDKSRRIGATYAESYKACRDRNIIDERRDYWFSSADESAAFEYALYCRKWCEMIEAVVKEITETLEDDQGYKYNNYVVEFPNKSRINCMSSNPRRFRSKGGDVDLDEFDWHDKPGEMLDAATPVTTWGFNLSIMTTRNGEGSEFDKIVNVARKVHTGELNPETDSVLPWSYHFTPITVAIQQGLAEKIYQLKRVSFAARKKFFLECRAKSRNEDAFNQEYMCVPSAAASTLIPYELYEACQADNILGVYGDGDRFVGFDVGRTNHPTIIWDLEQVGDVLIARDLITLRNQPYGVQKQVIADKLRNPKVVRACGDATGIGDMLVEELQKEFGEYRVEKFKFTAPSKDVLAGRVLGHMQDRRCRLPNRVKTRDSFHSIKKTVSAGGAVRYDTTQTQDEHGDEFWAYALALEAAHEQIVEPECVWL